MEFRLSFILHPAHFYTNIVNLNLCCYLVLRNEQRNHINSMSSSASGSSSSRSNDDAVGMKVDLEMKALVIVGIVAAIKALNVSSSSIFINFSRGFFVLGHAFFVYIFLVTNFRISKSTSRSSDEKAKAKAGCSAIMKGIFVRAVILALVHYKTGMLPPMFVTVFMGFCSMIENDFLYQIMYSKVPGLFEVLYR